MSDYNEDHQTYFKPINELVKAEASELEPPKKRARKNPIKTALKYEDTQPHSAKSKGRGAEWSMEEDNTLRDSVKLHLKNGKIPWVLVYPDFKLRFPNTTRSLMSVQMRYVQALKDGDTDLSADEIKLFQQAVHDIAGSEKNAAIAWRFTVLGGKQLNKGAVAKLLKLHAA